MVSIRLAELGVLHLFVKQQVKYHGDVSIRLAELGVLHPSGGREGRVARLRFPSAWRNWGCCTSYIVGRLAPPDVCFHPLGGIGRAAPADQSG